MPPADSRSPGPTPWRAFLWLLGGELRAHPGRAALALAALAVGVALGYAVHIVNQSALNEFSRAMASVSGRGDFEITGLTEGIDETLYGKIAGLADVGDLLPVVEADATLAVAGNATPVHLIGTDALRAAAVSPTLQGRPAASAARTPIDDDALFLPPARAARLNLLPGAKVEISTGGRHATFVLAGDLPGLEDESGAVIDIAAFQWRFDRVGHLSRIIVKSRPGADLTALSKELRAVLPPGMGLSSPSDRARRDDA